MKDVGVMKDEELQLEDIEASHTLGGYRKCRCYSAVRYTIVSRSVCGKTHVTLDPTLFKFHELEGSSGNSSETYIMDTHELREICNGHT